MTAVPIRRLDSEQIDAAPTLYLASLAELTCDVVAELVSALDAGDTPMARRACLRLTSIGALAGIVGEKL